MLKLSLRYWRVHWKKLIKVLFAMILSSAALMIAFLLARSSTEKSVQDVLNVNGNYDIVVQDLTKSQLDIFASDDQIAEYGIVQNGGVCCTKNETMIPYGAFLSKKAVDMFHYPVEKGGHYPQKSGEIAGYESSFPLCDHRSCIDSVYSNDNRFLPWWISHRPGTFSRY